MHKLVTDWKINYYLIKLFKLEGQSVERMPRPRSEGPLKIKQPPGRTYSVLRKWLGV